MPTGGPCGAMPSRQLSNILVVSFIGMTGSDERLQLGSSSYRRLIQVEVFHDGWHVVLIRLVGTW